MIWPGSLREWDRASGPARAFPYITPLRLSQLGSVSSDENGSALSSISFIQIIGSDANILLQPQNWYNWAQIFAGGPGDPEVETITNSLELSL